MEPHIRIIGIKRAKMDEEKLALAFLMLAKTLHEQKQQGTSGPSRETSEDVEAA